MYYEQVGVTHQSGDKTPWVPWEIGEGVFIKLMKVDSVHGLMAVMLKAPPGISLGRHRHTGFVQLYTVQGAWKYKEHEWTAKAGDFVYETADSIHSFETMPGDEVIVFTMLNGNLEFLDDDNKILHVENWRTALNRHMRHCAKLGIPCPDVTSFIES
jgi:quercetin dioxygenase-like cupin family protein